MGIQFKYWSTSHWLCCGRRLYQRTVYLLHVSHATKVAGLLVRYLATATVLLTLGPAWGARNGDSIPLTSTTSPVEPLTGNGSHTPPSTSTLRGPSTIATFRVRGSVGGLDNRWSFTWTGHNVTLGPASLRDPKGAVSGYHVVNGGASYTVTSDTWIHGNQVLNTYEEKNAYAVALYANGSNPVIHPDSSGITTHGYVPDLSVYGAGSGPGWVAVDSESGNALLLTVSSSISGSVITSGSDYTAGYPLMSPLGARGANNFASVLSPGFAKFATSLTGAIGGDYPIAALGCSIPNPYAAYGATCTGGNLRVTITPVGVVRGDVLGVRTSHTAGGGSAGGAWSPGGTYTLYLSGVTVYS